MGMKQKISNMKILWTPKNVMKQKYYVATEKKITKQKLIIMNFSLVFNVI